MPLRPKANGRGAALGGGNAAIAAGRVLQSFRGFLPKAVTQTQSSLFPPLTAFR